MDSSSSAATPRPTAQPRSASVLIVDDAVESDDPLVRWLLLDGFEVHCTQLGAAGLLLAQSGSIDAVILDLHLPDMAGVTVLNELRRLRVMVPVIAVTGRYLTTDHERVSTALGAVRFLPKPLDATELVTILRDAITTPRPSSAVVIEPTVRCAQPSSYAAAHAMATHFHELHASILSGDPTVIEPLMRDLLIEVSGRLHRRWLRIPFDWIHDAVVDALLDYVRRPARFDHTRGIPLPQFIHHAARQNLLNRIDSERRRLKREATLDNMKAPTLADHASQPAESRWTQLAGAIEQFSKSERDVLQLWIDGETRTAEFARVLQLNNSDSADCLLHVRRVKERIRQRLRRWLSQQRTVSNR
jgi:CheY-like chemotaxis protein